ncbi:MAG: hypothetical protein ABIV39_13165 [Verrucomicrobiota bacterium]
MKKILPFALSAILFTTLHAAESGPKEALAKASKELANKTNYSWTATTKEADGSAGRLGNVEGKTEKSGLTFLGLSPGGIPVEVYMKGEKGVARALEGWQSFDEITKAGGTAAAIARFLKTYKTPAAQAIELANNVTELKEADGVISGELKAEAINELLLMGGRRREGQDAPKTTDTKGSVKFWIKDGALNKYEINVQGKITSSDRSLEIDRTTTIEINEIGSTKIEMPAEAKEKIS